MNENSELVDLKSTDCEKDLGIYVDYKLKYDYVNNKNVEIVDLKSTDCEKDLCIYVDYKLKFDRINATIRKVKNIAFF